MACFHPLKAFANPRGGKPFFSRPAGHSGRVLDLACGRCIGCRIDRASEWSARIVHECLFWEDNWFLTLTFDDEHYPANASIDRRDVQLFFMRLRGMACRAGLLEGAHVRYFYNGEYGESTHRAHYHSIVFGLRLTDLKKWKKNERGEQMWTSDFLSEVWGNGRVVVGAVTRASAAYVAGYCLRDTKAKHSPYGFVDPETGELVERVAPFVGMSRRPGIGRDYFEKYGGQLVAGDFVVIEGRKLPTPRYYRRLLEKQNPELFESLKAIREREAYSARSKAERRPARLAAREVVTAAKRGMRLAGSRGAV